MVICADSGRVLAMVWKDGKIDERTTLAARPPQYAWIPKLELVSDVQLVPSWNGLGARDCNSQDEVDKALQHDDEPRSVHSKCSPAHHRETQMVTDTRLSTEVGNEASENTSDSDAAESASQVQPTGQIARSQS